jgi:hypothetical protein
VFGKRTTKVTHCRSSGQTSAKCALIDPIFLSILSDIFSSLAASTATGLYETVVKRTLPELTSVIGTADPKETWVSSSAIDIVTSLIRGAPEAGIGEGFFALLAPGLFKTLTEVEDRDTIQVNSLS